MLKNPATLNFFLKAQPLECGSLSLRVPLTSLTFGVAVQASACRKGSHIMIKDRACKIVEMSTSKTGKHGHAKCKFMAIDIFDGTKHEKIESSTHNVDVSSPARSSACALSYMPRAYPSAETTCRWMK